MWTLNATWGVTTGTGFGQTWVPWLPAVGGMMGMVAVVTVILNVFLLVSILLHPSSRSRSFHLHIVNMAVVAVLQGAGVLPMWAHYIIQGTWLHGDSVCRWWLAADVMATSASALAIVVTACDRFIYLVCWRFVKEGGKYVTCCALMALAWLLALALTLTMTLMEVEEDGRSGVHADGQCLWGQGKMHRVLVARLLTYALGAGLGAGLCLALVTLPCLGMGHVLPIDDDDDVNDEETMRKSSLLQDSQGRPAPRHRAASKQGDEDEDFPRFLIIRKSDRLEERERWKWQVVSLLTVSLAWVVLWLPSHLFAFSDLLGLEWRIPHGAIVASVIVGYAHAAVMPLLWLLHQPIRVAMAALVFCRCCRGNGEDPDDSIEFQDVGPYRPAEVTG